MSAILAAFFFGAGLLFFVQPEGWIQFEREVKTFGTNKDADEIEFEDWWMYAHYIFGIFSFLMGGAILFDVI